METTFYAIIVALLAIVYCLIARKIQRKFGNQKEMEALSLESKKLSEEYKKASERNDKKAMEEIMAKQMTVMKKMWVGVFAQFKTMIPILALFFIFTWGIEFLDPTTQDDITIDLRDDGLFCDKTAGDGIYTGCYKLNNEKQGEWIAEVKAYKDGNLIGENSTAFLVGKGTLTNTYLKKPSGNSIPIVSTDKKEYSLNDNVEITAKLLDGDSAKATLNRGTRFYVELPFTLPLIIMNIKTINEANSWFIFVAIISGLLISFLTARVKILKKWLG